ncbi:MAG: TetR/AcrR family transcriptional regulator C-terminal domain-containing protein [Chloroflexota bacterium]
MKTVQANPESEPRSPLSRERVLGAAIELADASGIDSLSMRKLAQKLGVEAMSLYHYFARKDELLDAMLDVVFSEMELPSTGPDWRSDMRTCAISAKDVLLRHSWAAQLLGSPTNSTPARFVWMNAVLGRLRGAGFSRNMTHHAYHALDSHIEGFVLWVLPYIAIERERPEFAEQFLENFPYAELPHLAEHIQEHVEDAAGDTSEFDFGLDLILDGLEKLRGDA